MRLLALPVAGILLTTAAPLHAEPLSRKHEIDFFRDVPSRNLKGLATRADGRLVAGPTLTELSGSAPADLLWSLESTPDAANWLAGSGPDGKIFEVTVDAKAQAYASREWVKLDDPHVFALRRLADGAVLAGTSPKGALYLLRAGKVAARVALPVDSIFDLLLVDELTALVATGNPGRIYRVDLAKFSAGGTVREKLSESKDLAEHGIALFGEIRDRNVRRLALLADGRVVAGSAPKGNIYSFGAIGEPVPSPRSPVILQENRDAEVTDLLPQADGDFYATIVFSSSSGESRITPPAKSATDAKAAIEVPPPAQAEKFGGRSTLVWFPAHGFPETLMSRSGGAVYRLQRWGDLLVMAGGEQGDLFGYDPKARLSLTFAGSTSAQLNGLVPLPGAAGKFLALRNNAPGFALLDFISSGLREAETRRIDLNAPGLLGTLRFSHLGQTAADQLELAVRVSNGSDEVEGWTAWTPLKLTDPLAPTGAGWSVSGLRGRYLKLRLRLPLTSTAPEFDKPSLFVTPQNRRPVLQEFRVLSPGFGIVAAAEPPPSTTTTISQLISQPPRDEDAKRRETFLRSQIVPSPGTQVVFWNVTDPDGDNVLGTFSVRRTGDNHWLDLAVATRESYVQFDTAHLREGVYVTRLVATEADPRPAAERLSATFETDDLVVDHTPPEILEAGAKREGDHLVVTLHGRDALSLLEGIEVSFNNGLRESVDQPDDGIRDSREERFTLNVPMAKAAGATSAEVILYDAAGNSAAKRVSW